MVECLPYSKGDDEMGNKLTDALIATGKGAVSVFPGGGFLAEYISLAQGYIADKRMNEWKLKVEEVLEKIPRSIDELAQDEAFYSCIQVATMGAMRAYQKEKQELFANALYSSANNIDISTDKKLFYLSLLDSYTLSHIMLLKYFSQNNYNENDNVIRGGMVTTRVIGGTEHPMKGIVEKMPCFTDDTIFVKHIAGQLCSDSLISIVDFETPVSKERARAKRTTKYGDEFLAFIQNYQ